MKLHSTTCCHTDTYELHLSSWVNRHDGEGQWVKFHVMREDSNDGKLILKTNAISGPNLMITKVVLVTE